MGTSNNSAFGAERRIVRGSLKWAGERLIVETDRKIRTTKDDISACCFDEAPLCFDSNQVDVATEP